MPQQIVENFPKIVYGYYQDHGRHGLPWRQPDGNGTFDAYKIAVSEIMLQQTQVNRVVPFYERFLQRFPTVDTLAGAPLGEVVTEWNGLGYNRRAKFLWQTAKQVWGTPQGTFPKTVPELTKLPGIGKNTAGAIAAYAFNQPAVFVETNIKTVFVYHFLQNHSLVTEAEIVKLAEQYLDYEQPRIWYWALMDYGSYIKQREGNLAKLVRGYKPQPAFAGSQRQIRGQIISLLSAGPHNLRSLQKNIPDKRLEHVLDALLSEGLIRCTTQGLSL